MVDKRSHIVIIAGPNGSGKSTSGPQLLRGALEVAEFVNADAIASGLSAFFPEGTAVEAGRVMLRRLRSLAAQRVDFAFETTLASRSFAPWVSQLRSAGYDLTLVFLWLTTPELAIQRVRERVAAGGHDVPEQAIRRRFRAGMHNFFHLYRPLASRWLFYDNTDLGGPRLVAHGETDRTEATLVPDTWRRVKAQVADAN